ncbi:hypothetical protein [Pseudomonas sp. NPDC089406]|uniref:hypothetical protein n=1 Tax=Pseudomonas sp. NPDC089406 TaxID=3364463 RepID=UPI00384FF133
MLTRALTLLVVATLPGLAAHQLRAFAHRGKPKTCALRGVMNMAKAFVKVIQFHSKRPLPTLRLNY